MTTNGLRGIQAINFGILFTFLANVNFLKNYLWLEFLIITVISYLSDVLIKKLSKNN
jgi:hypothetical protein